MQEERTIHSSLRAGKARTFRSGPYLNKLFARAGRMDQELQAEICARIKQAREEAGFTQPEMADLLEMSARGYQNYESIRVPFRKLARIADLTGVSQRWLIHGDPEETTPPATITRLEAQVADLKELQEEVLRLVRELRGD